MDQLRAQRSVTSMGKLYLFYIDITAILAILQLPAYALPSLSLLLALYQKLSR